MAKQIQDMTPVEIDTELSKLWGEQQVIQMRLAGYRKTERKIRDQVHQIKCGKRIPGLSTALQGIELMQKLDLVRTDGDIAMATLADLKTQALPYENEYVARGGWNRVFLAQSSDGHAHNGAECSTCHHGESRTQFAWLIQYSGKDEVEIVADAGERACTTCYPTAPVNAKGTKMFTPDEIEAQQARDEREAERTRKAAEAKAKSITTPEGAPLYENKENSWKISTVRVAEIATTQALADLILSQRHATDPEWAWLYKSGRMTREQEQMRIARHAWCLIRAIAAKKGLTFQEVFEAHEKKAQAKLRRIDREWARDPRNQNRTK